MLGFNMVQDAIGGLNVLNTYRSLQLLEGRSIHIPSASPSL